MDTTAMIWWFPASCHSLCLHLRVTKDYIGIKNPCDIKDVCALSMLICRVKCFKQPVLWKSPCWIAEYLASIFLMYIKPSLGHCQASLKHTHTYKSAKFYFKEKQLIQLYLVLFIYLLANKFCKMKFIFIKMQTAIAMCIKLHISTMAHVYRRILKERSTCLYDPQPQGKDTL